MVGIRERFHVTTEPTVKLRLARPFAHELLIDGRSDPVVLTAEGSMRLAMPLLQFNFEANEPSSHPPTLRHPYCAPNLAQMITRRSTDQKAR